MNPSSAPSASVRAKKRGRNSSADRASAEAGTTKRPRAPEGWMPLPPTPTITVTTGAAGPADPFTWKLVLPPLARDQLKIPIQRNVVTTPVIKPPPGKSFMSIDCFPVQEILPEWKLVEFVDWPESGWSEMGF